uniref:Uncharacterized protein n=1 Tax=Coccidioides posadasii RMSCC 3488 TaxID=454284 RepID=A0A0J6F704_COCPO|nr:hypothetical protein CPAG_05060 [Coccidioides posadasii RMSCC 3488]
MGYECTAIADHGSTEDISKANFLCVLIEIASIAQAKHGQVGEIMHSQFDSCNYMKNPPLSVSTAVSGRVPAPLLAAATVLSPYRARTRHPNPDVATRRSKQNGTWQESPSGTTTAG